MLLSTSSSMFMKTSSICTDSPVVLVLLAPEATPEANFLTLPGLGLLTRGKGGLELGSPPSEVLAPAPLSLLNITSSQKGLRQVLQGHKVSLSANVWNVISWTVL